MDTISDLRDEANEAVGHDLFGGYRAYCLAEGLGEPTCTMTGSDELTWRLEVHTAKSLRYIHVSEGDDIHWGVLENSDMARDPNTPDEDLDTYLDELANMADTVSGTY